MSNIDENQGTSVASPSLSDQQVDLDAVFTAAFSGKPVEIPAADPSAAPSSPETPPTAAQTPPGDAPTTETPAPAAGESAANDGKAPPAPPNPNDWISTVTDEALRARIIELVQDRNALAHKYNSDKPRLDQARRTVQQLQQKLASYEAPGKTPSAPTPNASKPNGETPIPARPPEWSKVVEVDQELANGVEKLLETRLSQMAEQLRRDAEQQAQAAVAPYAQYHADDAQQREIARLDAACNNWRDVVATPQYREYLEYWAPPLIKRAHAESSSADDAIMVLQHFQHYAEQRWPQPATSAAQPAEAASPNANTSVADRLAQDAARRAATAVNPNSRQAPPVVPASASDKPPTEDELNKILLAAYKKGNR
jgi:hypothetical protein